MTMGTEIRAAASTLPEALKLSRVLLRVADLVHGGEPVEHWKEVLAAEFDPDGYLGGDPGDVVVSMAGDSRAYGSDEQVTYVMLVDGSSHWDNDERHPVEDWQYEVANGDTRLGYREWVRQQAEMARGEQQ